MEPLYREAAKWAVALGNEIIPLHKIQAFMHFATLLLSQSGRQKGNGISWMNFSPAYFKSSGSIPVSQKAPEVRIVLP